jgi:hypothetical protein
MKKMKPARQFQIEKAEKERSQRFILGGTYLIAR